MKGVWITYSAEEMAWLEAHRLMVIGDYARSFNKRFGREVSAAQLHSLRKRKGWKTGRTGCFEKGSAPHNRGKKCAPGTGGLHPNARKTQFGRGHLPHNTKFLGHERVSKDGYVEISIADTNPHTGFERRYVLKHRYMWEQANGPVPKSHCLKCLDGNKQNTDPSNWECVPRALLPRLAGGNRYRRVLAFDDASPEVRPALLTVAKLALAAGSRRAKTPEAVECEASQSGPKGNAQNPPPKDKING